MAWFDSAGEKKKRWLEEEKKKKSDVRKEGLELKR